MKRIQLLLVLSLITGATAHLSAKQYYGSFFGMESDGITNNTGSMQKAIDFISEKGEGDTLTLWVGRYLIGSIELRSNVTIQLREGAILVGLESAHDYQGADVKAMLRAEEKENITIFGQGVIDGSAIGVCASVEQQRVRDLLPANESALPLLVAMKGCKKITIKGITLQNGASDAQRFIDCTDVLIDNITVFNAAVKGNRGVVAEQNSELMITNSFFNTSGTPIEAIASPRTSANNCITPTGTKVLVK